MTISFPTSGSYIDYADRWVDPALAFGAGLAEWLATFFVVLVDYWAEVSLFLVICLAVFFMPNIYLARLQYVGSLVKVFLFVFFIISLAIIGGAGPSGLVKDGSAWTDLPTFKNGFGGFASAAFLAAWSVGDQIYIGVLGGEARSPRRLLGGLGSAASPFVIAVDNAGIKGVPDLVNACMIIGIVAIALECIYLPSCMLRTMAVQKLIPLFIAYVAEKGRPRWALLITGVVGVVLTYINLSGKGTEVLNWFITITTFISFRFRAAVKAQKATLFTESYSWQSPLWPLTPVIVLVVSALLLVCLLYSSINSVNGTNFTAYSFYSNILGILVILVPTALYKVILRTKWRDPKTIDLVTGGRQLSAEEILLLDEHYSRPLWRWFGTYVRVW
ncbi:hypothetical protein BDW68DRAFT_193637 [Aspergillus falconensis]